MTVCCHVFPKSTTCAGAAILLVNIPETTAPGDITSTVVEIIKYMLRVMMTDERIDVVGEAETTVFWKRSRKQIRQATRSLQRTRPT